MMFPGCVENWTIIMDISEVGIFNFPLSLLGKMSQLFGDLFPTRMNKIFIINATKSVRFSWSAVENVLDSSITSKTFVLSKDEYKKMKEDFHEEQIEDKYGGTLKMTQFWPPQNTLTPEYLRKYYNINVDSRSRSTSQKQQQPRQQQINLQGDYQHSDQYFQQPIQYTQIMTQTKTQFLQTSQQQDPYMNQNLYSNNNLRNSQTPENQRQKQSIFHEDVRKPDNFLKNSMQNYDNYQNFRPTASVNPINDTNQFKYRSTYQPQQNYDQEEDFKKWQREQKKKLQHSQDPSQQLLQQQNIPLYEEQIQYTKVPQQQQSKKHLNQEDYVQARKYSRPQKLSPQEYEQSPIKARYRTYEDYLKDFKTTSQLINGTEEEGPKKYKRDEAFCGMCITSNSRKADNEKQNTEENVNYAVCNIF